MPRRHGFVLCFLLALSAVRTEARDIFVSNVAGDDQQTGHAEISSGQGSGPTRTISRALRIARAGDRILLANTGIPYRESLTLQGGRHSGSARSRFVIQGNGAVLDGSAAVPADAWRADQARVFGFRPRRGSFGQLFIDDVPAPRRFPAAPGQLPELQPRQWCLLSGRVHFCVEPGKGPEDYQVSFAALPVGLTLYEVRHVVIQDLIVQGFQLDGINAHDSVLDTALVSVTSRGNGRSGVSVGGSSRVRLEACLIGNNGAAQLRTEGWSKTEVVGCDLIPNTAPGWVLHGKGRLLIDGKAMAGSDARFVLPRDGTVPREVPDQPARAARLNG